MLFDVEEIRKDFPILGREVYGRPLVYFDNAATTQKPLCVLDAMREEYLNQNANVHRGVHYLSQQATQECIKSEMINFVNQHPNSTKTKYYRYGRWVEGEDVRVVDNRYLRTDANNYLADNLGSLPRY